MKKPLILILLMLTNGIYAETPINEDADFQILLSGLQAGEGRYIVEEGFSSDVDTPDKIHTSWLANYDCIGNGSIWSIKLPAPRNVTENETFFNSKMTINYYICPSVDQGETIDRNNCEKIASYQVGIDFKVENKKVKTLYTPNKINVDVSGVANNYPACTPKPRNSGAKNSNTNPHNIQS